MTLHDPYYCRDCEQTLCDVCAEQHDNEGCPANEDNEMSDCVTCKNPVSRSTMNDALECKECSAQNKPLTIEDIPY